MPEMDGLTATEQIRSFESKINNYNKASKITNIDGLQEDNAHSSSHHHHHHHHHHQQGPKMRHVPIIALTADVSTETQERCLQSGMDSFLGKPVNMERLKNVLERFLKLKLELKRG